MINDDIHSTERLSGSGAADDSGANVLVDQEASEEKAQEACVYCRREVAATDALCNYCRRPTTRQKNGPLEKG